MCSRKDLVAARVVALFVQGGQEVDADRGLLESVFWGFQEKLTVSNFEILVCLPCATNALSHSADGRADCSAAGALVGGGCCTPVFLKL